MKRLQNQLLYAVGSHLRKFGHGLNSKADERIVTMRSMINALEHHAIEFRVEQYPDGSWSAESVNIEGIMTGGRKSQEIPDMLKDAIFTYFEIPPHLCEDNLLRSDNEPVTVEQRVHVGA